MTGSAEQKVEQIAAILREKGHPVPRTIDEIPDFPCRTWNELLEAWKSDRLLLQRFSVNFDGDTFGMFATRGERILSPIYGVGMFLVPVASIALAYLHSWGWLIGLLFPIVAFKKQKGLYNGAIYRAAFSAEPIFCYLYFLKQVNLATPDFKRIYYWGAEKKDEEDGPATAAKITRENPIMQEFEQEISTWPREQAVIALQLLEATLSGDGDTIDKLYPELTPKQFHTVTNLLRRIEAAEGST